MEIYEKAEKITDQEDTNDVVAEMKKLNDYLQTLPSEERDKIMQEMQSQVKDSEKQSTIAWLAHAMILLAKFRIENPDKSIINWMKQLEKDDKKKLQICLESGSTNWREFEWCRLWLTKELFGYEKVDAKVFEKIEAMRIQDARESIVAYMTQGMLVSMFKTTGGSEQGFQDVLKVINHIRLGEIGKKKKT